MDRNALVIGINDYPRLGKLTMPATDAEAIAEILNKYGGFKVTKLPENPEANLNLDDLKAAIVKLFPPQGEHTTKTALLFFAGHGLREELGTAQVGYLAASDSSDSRNAYGLPLQLLRQLLQNSSVLEQIVWLDCCHSGNFINLREADPGSTKGYNRCFIAACRGDQMAHGVAGHGVLTTALLAALDPEKHFKVTTKTLVAAVTHELRKLSLPQDPIHEYSGEEVVITYHSEEEVPESQWLGICPYKGLEFFDDNEQDAKLFCGRQELTGQLLQRLRQNDFLIVTGASGSGKSSAVRAGLLYELRKGEQVSGSDRWLIIRPFTPGAEPLQNIEQALSQSLPAPDTSNSVTPLLDRLPQLLQTRDHPIVLVVDQFEEAFTICKDKSKQKLFFDYLMDLSEQYPTLLKVIIIMRSDFRQKLDQPESRRLVEKLYQQQSQEVIVTAMSRAELDEAIRKPLKKVNLLIEDSLVRRILEDLGITEAQPFAQEPGSLPLLEYTLYLLWQKRNQYDPPNLLQLKAYEKLNGVKGALEQQAEKVYNEELKTSEQQQAAEWILVQLTNIEPGAEYTRRRVAKTQLKSSELPESLINEVLDILKDKRLVVENEEQVEVAHEALIRHWSRLQQLLNHKRDIIQQARRIEAQVKQWKESPTSTKPDYLLRGNNLKNADEFLKIHRRELSKDAVDVITLSIQEDNRLEREKRLRKRRNITLAVVLPLLILSAVGLWVSARSQEQINKSLQLANASETNLNIDTTRSLWLAIAAKLTQDTPQADLALWDALQANHERLQLVGHTKEVLYAEFAPGNSQRVLTVSRDRTARIWDLNNLAHPLILNGHEDVIKHGSFDPKNPKRVLTVSYDGTARIWNLDNLSNPIILKGHEAPINYGSFDPNNSNRVLTVSSDGTARVWNIDNPNNPLVLKGHEGDIWVGSFDPQNSNRVLTVSSDSTARIWNLSQPDKPLILKGHKGQVVYGSFDPKNSNRVLTVSSDRTARIWNVNTPSQPIVLQGHSDTVKYGSDTVKYGSFDPQDSNRVLTVSEDGTARIWNLKNPDQPQILRGHQSEILYGAFNPEDTNQILTVSADGTARIWDLKTSTTLFTLRGHTQGVSFGTFDPKDPSRILTASDDSTARIWDIRDSSLIKIASSYNVINSIFDIENSNQVLTISREGRVKKWNINNLKDSKSLPIQMGLIEYAWFAPSNPSRIATIRSDGKIYIWNLQEPDKSLEMPKGKGKISELRFDPKNPNRILRINKKSNTATVWNINNKTSIDLQAPIEISTGEFDPNDPDRIITASVDGTIYVWSLKEAVKTSKPLFKLNVSQQVIWRLSVDPKNSNRILIMGSDRVARIWDIDSRTIIAELSGSNKAVVDGGFDPNNPNRVLTVSYDGTARIWDLRIPSNPLIFNNGYAGKLIYGIFDSHNSNRFLSVSINGQVNIYNLDKEEVLKIAWKNLSRCLTSKELKNYNLVKLNILDLLSSYFQQSTKVVSQGKYRPNCQP